jgi:thioredoxin 1
MKTWRHAVLGLVGLLGLLILWPVWASVAQASAAPQGKPALYEFGSKYCIPCKEMQKVMADLKAQYGDRLEVRMVYVDEQRPLFEQYRIVLIPTQVFLDASGKEVDRHMGAMPKEEVIRKLKDLKFLR